MPAPVVTVLWASASAPAAAPCCRRSPLAEPRAEALLTPSQMAAADAAAIAGGVSARALMAAAGRAVARAIQARFRPVRTLVLAGPGANGGDGWVVARLLEAAGWPVAVAPLAMPRAGTDAAHFAATWRGPVVACTPAEVARAGLVVDALYGAGLARDLDGAAVAALAAARGPVVAVDLPSGVDGATGQVRGFAAASALTVTFARAKPGHLLFPGRALCGVLHVAEIGIPAAAIATAHTAPRAWRNGPGLWHLPAPEVATHKHSRGHVTILGSAAMPGAARLAAAAARRAGAGLVTIASDAPAVYRAAEPGVLVTDARLAALSAEPRRKVWIIGPGLPADAGTRAALRQLIDMGRQIVADAGALMACAGAPDALAGAAVLTPHAGEFGAVFGPVGADKLAAARAAAARTGAVVVLKGADTVIAAPDGTAAINTNAPPWLATGGTGDVLAGMIAALLAQGLPPFDAAAAAVWWHGDAATRVGARLLAEDLPAAL